MAAATIGELTHWQRPDLVSLRRMHARMEEFREVPNRHVADGRNREPAGHVE
jgi:hypothetical protein